MGSFEFEAFNDEDNEDTKAINRYGKEVAQISTSAIKRKKNMKRSVSNIKERASEAIMNKFKGE